MEGATENGAVRAEGSCFNFLYCGVKGSGGIAVSSTDIIGAVDRKEDLELALIDKIMEDSWGRSGIDGQRYREVRRSRRCDEEGSRIWKHAIKFSLEVKKLRRAKVRRAGVVSRCEDSCHTQRNQCMGRARGRGQGWGCEGEEFGASEE